MGLKKIASAVLTFMAIVGFIIAIVGLNPTDNGVWYYIIICACLLAFMVCAVILLAILIKNQSLFIRFVSYILIPKSPLILRQKECVYTFEGRTHMTFQKRITIQSKTKELKTYYGRYIWTKDYKQHPIETINSDTITEEYREEYWQYYCISFDTFYGKNKVHETGIYMPSLSDPNKESQLYLSTGIDEPTINACLKVIIKNGLKFSRGSTFCDIFYYDRGRAYDERIPVKIVTRSDDDGGGYEISHNIKYPVKNARYKLIWKFDSD